ncbi:hypothetical protein DUI87_08913 [Hirundo rustica rustica]|uniref:Uncharacterized protein n=1 Tax=Hirundo rustica rustica TaxID=333673 RepID=A0A3M0KSW3_HIRRU|nr:hypothetical protein DUI87_08913 [Hirundo rustica rustica]
MLAAAAALACVCAAAWCSPAAAAAGGRPDSGNFLDDKQWLTTISQYDKEVGQWNKFRDVFMLLDQYLYLRRTSVQQEFCNGQEALLVYGGP